MPRHEPGAPWSLVPVPALPSPTVQTYQGPCVPHTALPSWTGGSCFQAIPHRASGITSWVIPQIARLPRQPASRRPSLGGPRVLPRSPRPPPVSPASSCSAAGLCHRTVATSGHLHLLSRLPRELFLPAGLDLLVPSEGPPWGVALVPCCPRPLWRPLWGQPAASVPRCARG